MYSIQPSLNFCLLVKCSVDKSFPKQQISDCTKLKDCADDNFKFNENAGELSKMVENTCEKRRNCSLRAISPFSTVFSKDLYYRHVKSKACMGES